MLETKFAVIVTHNEDFSKVSVQIGSDRRGPDMIKALVAATEHMINCAALESALPYEECLKSLCDGARTGRVLNFHGNKPQ